MACPTVRPLPVCRGIRRVVAMLGHLLEKSNGLPKQAVLFFIYRIDSG